ncbi:TetR family transcriptional regulator [Flindersiella endophytica]
MPTRERLIETAIELFGERGIAATSLRALTETAGTNIAAVNYHFRSKEGLLRAVIDETMRAVNAERRRRLDELEAASQPPPVPELVRAFVEPGLHPDRAVARFLGRVISEPDPRVRQLFAEQVAAVEGRYEAALGAFPYACMLGLLAVHQSGAFAALDDGERLIEFITAGVVACG